MNTSDVDVPWLLCFLVTLLLYIKTYLLHVGYNWFAIAFTLSLYVYASQMGSPSWSSVAAVPLLCLYVHVYVYVPRLARL